MLDGQFPRKTELPFQRQVCEEEPGRSENSTSPSVDQQGRGVKDAGNEEGRIAGGQTEKNSHGDH